MEKWHFRHLMKYQYKLQQTDILHLKRHKVTAYILGTIVTRMYAVFRLSGNLVGISINLCKSIQKELFINDTP